jgi:UDP-2,4-diacetamido-2,4,6-trideoxy-beta-L-altropyranose hydrolase
LEKPGQLVICAESGVQIGTGHVMRSLALAQAWKRAGGAVTFIVREGFSGIEDRIRAEGISVERLSAGSLPTSEAFVEAALRFGSSVVVLDGYGFGASDLNALSQAGIRVLIIDDYGHAGDYSAQWVLNQNSYAEPRMYPLTKADTRLLLGSSYAMLREEFLPWIGWERSIPQQATKILITIGGSDPENVSKKVLSSLEILRQSDLELVLVIGGGNPHSDELLGVVERCLLPVRVERSVQDMPRLMAWADVAIAGAGITSYELCYMGLPSLLLIVAENQRGIAERLSEIGAAANAGTSQEFCSESFASQLKTLIDSDDRRKAMSQHARKQVDGLGSERVRAALLDREVRLRPVCETDRRLLFEWVQDPVSRAASFHSAPITWEDHSRWFAERLHDPNSVIYIGENANHEQVGLVRFHIADESAVLSVNVAPEFRSKGWGKELIFFSTRMLARARSIKRIEALVKPANYASVSLFEASGFQQTLTKQIAGQTALLFTWECEETNLSTKHVN